MLQSREAKGWLLTCWKDASTKLEGNMFLEESNSVEVKTGGKPDTALWGRRLGGGLMCCRVP